MTTTIITPTGGRPEAFALLNGYMLRQTYRGPVHWIIVDDVDPRTAKPREIPDGWHITVIHPTEVWQPGQNTQLRNLLTALGAMLDNSDRLLIMEDDDWYSANYIQRMNEWLDYSLLVGEGYARYYHVPARLAQQMGNSGHASLCSTGMCGGAIQTFVDVVIAAIKNQDTQTAFVDIDLWAARVGAVMPYEGLSVGMKGLPGRLGIGMGHMESMMAQRGERDENGNLLRQWIGADAEAYLT